MQCVDFIQCLRWWLSCCNLMRKTFPVQALIMERISDVDRFMELVMNQNNLAKKCAFVYQRKLAAKTFKDNDFVDLNKSLFEREMNIWINIDCSNIAQLLKICFIRGKLYALMPFYSKNLRELIVNSNHVEFEFAKKSILEIIRGLSEVKKKFGIVHMDLKPENILVDFHEDTFSVYICDWGISTLQKKSCSELPSKDFIPPSFVNTMKGMGTLPYMSPERLKGSTADVSADIYSLGLMFYELLFLALPYNEMSSKTLEAQILNHDYYYIAEDALNNNFDGKICELILKCIHPDPHKRFHDYDRLAKSVGQLGKRKFFSFHRKETL